MGERRVLATGLLPLDRCLPGGGLPLGALTELLAGQGAPAAPREVPWPCPSGAWTFAAHLACQALRARQPPDDPGIAVFVDAEGDADPAPLLELGLPAARFLFVRPATAADAFWAFDQAIRCRAVACAVVRLTHLETAPLRRLQLAAREGGGLALLLRPGAAARNPSPAAARLWLRPAPTRRAGAPGLDAAPTVDSADELDGDPSIPAFSFAVEVLRARGGFGGGGARVEVRWNAEDHGGSPPHGTAPHSLHCVSEPLE